MARSVWDRLAEIEERVRAAPEAWVGLDFDGTLTPLVETPDRAILGAEMRDLLDELSRHERIKIAVISGRALHDIKAKIGLGAIAYSGNHGLEIEGDDFTAHYIPPPEVCSQLADSIRQIEERLSGIPGLLLENKGMSLSVHYRLAPPEQWESIREAVLEIAESYPELQIKGGARVWEILPSVRSDKGTAVAQLLARQAGAGALPIYLGDDLTDEDAFKAIPGGITIYVGRERPTAARYRLDDPPDVRKFLRWLISVS